MKTTRIKKQSNSTRIKLGLLFLFFALPLIVSYVLYYIMPPEGASTNYGELIQPQRPIPEALFAYLSLNHALPVKFNSLFVRKWRLISVNRAIDCTQSCVQKLFFMRQLRLAQGQQRTNIVPIWFVTDRTPVNPTLRSAYSDAYAAGHFIYVDEQPLKQWLPVETGYTLESYLYLIDPMGHLMMRFPAHPDSKKMHNDLSRLLKWNPI